MSDLWRIAMSRGMLQVHASMVVGMRVLSNTPQGKLILDPFDLCSLVAQSPQKSAAVVVVGKHLIASTAFTDHNSMLNAAGFEVRNFELGGDTDPSLSTFRGGMHGNSLTFEIWHRADGVSVDAHVDSIHAVFEFLAAHRCLRNIESLDIAIYDEEYVQTHTFDSSGLTDCRDPDSSRRPSA